MYIHIKNREKSGFFYLDSENSYMAENRKRETEMIKKIKYSGRMRKRKRQIQRLG